MATTMMRRRLVVLAMALAMALAGMGAVAANADAGTWQPSCDLESGTSICPKNPLQIL